MAKVASTIEFNTPHAPLKGDFSPRIQDQTDNSSDSADPNGPVTLKSLKNKYNAATFNDMRHSTVDTIEKVASSDFGLKASKLKFDPVETNFSHIEYTENGMIWLYESNSCNFIIVKDETVVDRFEFPD